MSKAAISDADDRLRQAGSAGEAGPAAISPVRPSRFADLMRSPLPTDSFNLLDIVGIVIGFALAARICRGEFRRIVESQSVGAVLIAGLTWVWLGVVLSGPLIIGVRWFRVNRRVRLRLGERLWLCLGVGWLVIAIVRMLGPLAGEYSRELAYCSAAGLSAVTPMLLLWALPVVAGSVGEYESEPASGWCNAAGMAIALTWPLGWVLVAVFSASW